MIAIDLRTPYVSQYSCHASEERKPAKVSSLVIASKRICMKRTAGLTLNSCAIHPRPIGSSVGVGMGEGGAATNVDNREDFFEGFVKSRGAANQRLSQHLDLEEPR